MKKASKKFPPFDQALPLALRSEVFSVPHLAEPSLSLPLAKNSGAVFSPHVVNLRPVLPKAVEHVQTVREVEETLPTFEEFVASLALSTEEQDDEIPVVHEEHVISQLAEDDRTSRHPWTPRLRVSLPALPHFAIPSWKFPTLPCVPRVEWRMWTSRSPLARGVASFVLLSFAFVLPLQATSTLSSMSASRQTVLTEGAKAMELLESAARDTAHVDFGSAKETFAKASVSLSDAWASLEGIGSGLRSVVALWPNESARLKSAEGVLLSGRALSKAAALLSEGLDAMRTTVDPNLSTKLSLLERYASEAMPFVKDAVRASWKVKIASLPSKHQEAFVRLTAALPTIENALASFVESAALLEDILGTDEAKRYLVVFQNQTELRPTGGFIGSFADVEISKGEVTGLHIPGGGSYDLQGAITNHVAAPRPLQLLTPRFEFQDANWFPNFPETARKLLSFDAGAGGATKDGVVAINASFVTDLLRITGPISLPLYGKDLTAENFISETQKIVESVEARASGVPKQFLADLAPVLLDRLTSLEGPAFLDALTLLRAAVAKKDVQAYFTDADLQSAARALGVTGEIERAKGDYLMVVEANIGGEKTDAVMEETVDVDSAIFENGRVRNTVTISRAHHGISGAPFTGANNVAFIRLYVPRGSVLIDVDGAAPPPESAFEIADFPLEEDPDLVLTEGMAETDPQNGATIGEEFGKTVFGHWSQVRPGATSVLSFTYELPWRVSFGEPMGALRAVLNQIGFARPTAHTLTIDAQSGTPGRTINVKMTTPQSTPVLWSSHPISEGVLTETLPKQLPGFFAVLFE